MCVTGLLKDKILGWVILNEQNKNREAMTSYAYGNEDKSSIKKSEHLENWREKLDITL